METCFSNFCYTRNARLARISLAFFVRLFKKILELLLSDESSQYIEPTVVTDVDIDDILMKDELFGPILPIIEVDGFNDAIKLIKTQEKPLAAYCFGNF